MNNSRSTMYYGGLQADKLARPFRKHYSTDGSMEIKQIGAVDTEFITYIGGDAYSAPVVLKSDGTTQNYLYLHRDYQGSIVAISNQSGVVVEKRLFDAWGELLRVQDQQGDILAGLTVLDRGYTGHEHLQSVGLIHMNGRLYDAKLHRFLQPDNYIQDPYNTQNYNRYGYVLNNPLKYTDPSGEIITIGTAILIGAIIGGTTYTLTALLTPAPFSVGGFLKASFFGGLSGAVTFGIGTAVQSLPIAEKIVAGAFMHGTSQGIMTGIQGGDPLSAFVSGAVSSIAAGLWSTGGAEGKWQGVGGAWAKSDFGTLAFGTFAGGAGAKLSGGNFWQGAVTGLVVSGLNHVTHKNNFTDDDDLNINSSEDLNKYIKGNKTLNKWYNKFSKRWSKFEVTLADRFTGGPSGKSEGLTNYFTEGGYATVTIYRVALQSSSYLFGTVLHEFGHVNGFYNGFYTSINHQYSSGIANSIDEVYAHRFANLHGGVTLNTDYYRSFLNHLKNNNININKIKFPSYD